MLRNICRLDLGGWPTATAGGGRAGTGGGGGRGATGGGGLAEEEAAANFEREYADCDVVRGVEGAEDVGWREEKSLLLGNRGADPRDGMGREGEAEEPEAERGEGEGEGSPLEDERAWFDTRRRGGREGEGSDAGEPREEEEEEEEEEEGEGAMIRGTVGRTPTTVTPTEESDDADTEGGRGEFCAEGGGEREEMEEEEGAGAAGLSIASCVRS